MNSIRLNYHISSLSKITSLLWSGHIIHHIIPASRSKAYPEAFNTNYKTYQKIQNDINNHVFNLRVRLGKFYLTFLGGLNLDSSSINLINISHHHLALKTLLI